MSIYNEMLLEVGITADLHSDTVSVSKYDPDDLRCRDCKDEPLTMYVDGFLTCHLCGLVSTKVQQYDHTDVPAYYNIQASKAYDGTYFEKKRVYKPLTHFKEHLRRYMGCRFTEIPDVLLDLLRELNVDPMDRDAFFIIKRYMKVLKFHKLYKEIFLIIYKLGGVAPKISDEIFHQCVDMYQALMMAFEVKKAEWKRHSMPSNYVVMDLLLRHFGHEPYYRLPCLKDQDLQNHVEWMIDELAQYWEFSPPPSK